MTVPVGATIVVVGDPPGQAALTADLERDVIDHHVVALDGLLAGTPPSKSVVLLWIHAAMAAPLFDVVARWSDGKRPRPGLIAWVVGGDHGDAERALAGGFDDVVIGACSTREIASRVRAVHRRVYRSRPTQQGRVQRGGAVLDLDSHELRIAGKAISLTAIELAVLQALMRAGGRTMSRVELLDRAWGTGNFAVGERAVDNVVLRLRRKLGDTDLIQTIRGVGFRIDE